MNVPKKVQYAFYNNVLGDVYIDEKDKLENREYYEDFSSWVTSEDVNKREKFWYDMVIDVTSEVVEKRYYIKQEELDLAIRIFNRKPLKEKKEIAVKYGCEISEISDLFKATEVYIEWFNEMYWRTVKYIDVEVWKKDSGIILK
ncbi:hypothetical protein [Bacillus toyonensis]|uniref:hypothetical protein n=1 Tax=Bacillus toyonensis TaxID=155322 RepID=UPI002E22D0EB|nr:hypothetical protein [Bacillus toyonensis]